MGIWKLKETLVELGGYLACGGSPLHAGTERNGLKSYLASSGKPL
jgi:hypothetical protein